MIISKTPLRMSFVGGGSDLPAYYREEEGAVISTTIDKYIYICLNKKFDGQIRLSYSKTENVNSRLEIEHPLVREALEMMDIDGGIEISSMADIPSKGSGLGSSSSFSVGLLNALSAHKNHFISKETLARAACEIEIDRCKQPIGKQDQYAAAFGGLNLFRFHSDERVSVDPIVCPPSLHMQLEQSILVFFTGRTRSASDLLATQSTSMKSQDKRALMRRMVELVFEMKRELEAGSLEAFGEQLKENWYLKAQLATGISNPEINEWFSTGLANGALGGKLLGAGNGGFMMFFAPPERHDQIANALSGLQRVRFGLDKSGAQIVFYQPTE